MRVAIYIRVSTLDQAREGYSLAAQRAALEHWAADRRHEIVRVYEDAGISAKDIKHRPAMRRLLWAAKREQYDILLVWALSRLTRSVMDLYSTAELLGQHKIALVSYTEAIDTSTPTGRAMMGMLGVFAQMEREVTVERVRAAMAERAAQGKRTCNCVLGYDLVGKDALSVNEREAEHVRFIYAAYLECGSLYAVVKRARAAGDPRKARRADVRGKREENPHPADLHRLQHPSRRDDTRRARAYYRARGVGEGAGDA